MSMVKQGRTANGNVCYQIAAIFLMWALAVWFVDPSGAFMINDDWCYVKCLEAFQKDGRLIQVGWGDGGPALITHLFWGDFFSRVFGFSPTTLRISTVIMGAAGTVSLLMLLLMLRVPAGLALLGTLTLMFNPLFFSQSFTFMTDVTFTSLAAMSMLFLCLGMDRSRTGLIILGLLFALSAILTRQLGIVLPLGFMGASLMRRKIERPNRSKLIILTLLLTFVPWLLVEYLFLVTGGPSILDFQGIDRILNDPGEKGLLDYPVLLLKQFFYNGLCYGALLVLPVLVFRIPAVFKSRGKRAILIILTLTFLLFEAALLLGLIDPPTPFYRNVIINFGIGPLLLKDTYILQMERLSQLPKPVYFLFVYGALVCGLVVLQRAVQYFKSIYRQHPSLPFPAAFSLFCAVAYLCIITLSGYHDRYLIPLCLFLIIWTLTDRPFMPHTPSRSSKVLAWTLLVLMAAFSTTATRDFMVTKRHVKMAQDFAVNTLKVDPCDMDGGFEFNGYHCSRKDFSAKGEFSWWWVDRETFVVTLGPLPGHETVRVFPFDRYLGKDGAVHLLRPHPEGSAPAANERTSRAGGTKDRQK